MSSRVVGAPLLMNDTDDFTSWSASVVSLIDSIMNDPAKRISSEPRAIIFKSAGPAGVAAG